MLESGEPPGIGQSLDAGRFARVQERRRLREGDAAEKNGSDDEFDEQSYEFSTLQILGRPIEVDGRLMRVAGGEISSPAALSWSRLGVMRVRVYPGEPCLWPTCRTFANRLQASGSGFVALRPHLALHARRPILEVLDAELHAVPGVRLPGERRETVIAGFACQGCNSSFWALPKRMRRIALRDNAGVALLTAAFGDAHVRFDGVVASMSTVPRNRRARRPGVLSSRR